MLQKCKTLPEAAAGIHNTRHLALAGTFLALLTVILIPFALVSPLPLSDYPNHVARMQIIAHLSESATLARHYYGSKAPFSVDTSQTFRMPPEEKGKAYLFPDIPLKRLDLVMLINPDYFSHDYPARFAAIYEKENVMLFKIRPQKGS